VGRKPLDWDCIGTYANASFGSEIGISLYPLLMTYALHYTKHIILKMFASLNRYVLCTPRSTRNAYCGGRIATYSVHPVSGHSGVTSPAFSSLYLSYASENRNLGKFGLSNTFFELNSNEKTDRYYIVEAHHTSLYCR